MSRLPWSVSVVAVAVVAAGCQPPAPEMLPDPVEVTGRVVFADGSPVKGVTLGLMPRGNGHPNGMKIGAAGAVSGNLIPGEYSFYFGPGDPKAVSEKTAAAAAMKRIPEPYHTPSADHVVQIKAGEEFKVEVK